MNCVAPGGVCPVVKGECEKDVECYLARCEHPHAPKPITDEDLATLIRAAREVA